MANEPDNKRFSSDGQLSTRGLYMCLLSSLLYFYQYMVKVAPLQCVNSIINDCNLSPTFTGMIMSVFLLGYTLAQAPVAAACEYYGPRRLMLICLSALSAISFLQSYTVSPAAILFVRFVTGIFCALALLATLEMCDRWLPPKYRGRAITAVVVFGIVGGMLSKAVVNVLLDPKSVLHKAIVFVLGECRYTWQNVFSALLVCSIALLTLYTFFLDDDGPYTVRADVSADAENPTGLMSRNMLTNYIYAWTSYLPLEVIGNTFAPKFAEDVGFAGFMNPQIAILLGMIVGLPIAGYLADEVFGYRMVLISAGFINGALVFSLPFVGIGHTAALLFFVVGVASSTSVLPIAFGAFLAPQSPGTARGFTNFAQMGGAALTAAGGSQLLQQFTQSTTVADTAISLGAYNSLWMIFGATMLASTLLFATLIRYDQVKS